MCLKFDLKYALQDQDVINLEYCHQLEQPAQFVALQQLALFRLSLNLKNRSRDKISSFHRRSEGRLQIFVLVNLKFPLQGIVKAPNLQFFLGARGGRRAVELFPPKLVTILLIRCIRYDALKPKLL